MTRYFTSLALLMLLAFSPIAANAKDKNNPLGSFRKWDAFKLTASNGAVTCYMISQPTKSLPENARRGDIYVTVTHRPKMKVKNEVNIIVGYPFQANSSPSAVVGSRSFSMFTEGDGAWLRSPKEDSDIVSAMKSGDSLVFHGTSSRGTNTRDTYSLSGFTAAYNAITKACS